MAPLVIYTDGSCPGNGYPYARGSIGVHCRLFELSESLPENMRPHTSPMAEMYAILRALETAPWTSLTIRTDSELSVDICNGLADRWKNNGGRTSSGKRPANWDLVIDVMQEITNYRCNGYLVKVEYVPGHAGHPGNERAHNLAQGTVLPRSH